jgi:hypothetical protein
MAFVDARMFPMAMHALPLHAMAKAKRRRSSGLANGRACSHAVNAHVAMPMLHLEKLAPSYGSELQW